MGSVFSKKMREEGIAILPKDGGIHAPSEGTIILVAETKHARTEVFIHVGLKEFSLNGQGFRVLVKNRVGVRCPSMKWDVSPSFAHDEAERR
ncbi:PTS glucose transporter subunit IIA [Cytobacillus solani]|uniref:PTS glucose transporter subunit IIA n=1 Tax=Cytobacillus solani TaxID=1637975 RepID=UPI00210FD28D|nr:PTS glucose transporter subunit IIA [Cytobacillus solani]USK57499.1 PTS glucose transporter subunit IIA [Cytobacillus solani]